MAEGAGAATNAPRSWACAIADGGVSATNAPRGRASGIAEGGGAATNAPRAFPRLVTDKLTGEHRRLLFDLHEEERRLGHAAFRDKVRLLEAIPCCGELLQNGEVFVMPDVDSDPPPPPEAFSASDHPPLRGCAGPFSIRKGLQSKPAFLQRFEASTRNADDVRRVHGRNGYILQRTAPYPQVGKKLYILTPVTVEGGSLIASTYRYCYFGSSDGDTEDADVQSGAVVSDLLAMNEGRIGSALENMPPSQLMGLVDEVCTRSLFVAWISAIEGGRKGGSAHDGMDW